MRKPLHGMVLALTLIAALGQVGPAAAQRNNQPSGARAEAPVDLTGYWVAVVSEDWRHRMATARKGDYESVPLNAEGRRAADSWDLAADAAADMQCRAFGIGGIMRQPGRLHISWEDDDTLRIDFDAGTQTRLLHFDTAMPAAAAPTWQGHSVAEWEGPPASRGGPVRAPIGNSTGPVAAGGGECALDGEPRLELVGLHGHGHPAVRLGDEVEARRPPLGEAREDLVPDAQGPVPEGAGEG